MTEVSQASMKIKIHVNFYPFSGISAERANSFHNLEIWRLLSSCSLIVILGSQLLTQMMTAE